MRKRRCDEDESPPVGIQLESSLHASRLADDGLRVCRDSERGGTVENPHRAVPPQNGLRPADPMASGVLQRLLEIGHEVGGGLDADTQADQVVGHLQR